MKKKSDKRIIWKEEFNSSTKFHVNLSTSLFSIFQESQSVLKIKERNNFLENQSPMIILLSSNYSSQVVRLLFSKAYIFVENLRFQGI